MVLKGLSSTTDIDDIKSDLANQGLPVMKVAQMTQRKCKFPLPMYLVEVRKYVPDSWDIRDISACCYISITWYSFRRRPGPSQCYNCNYFHHSLLNCEIKTRPTSNSTKTTPNNSYANVAKTDQQMAAQKSESEPATPGLKIKTPPLARTSS
ncbi:hypothetical protein TNCV_1246511 [Trichonephila clavipes]|uniref:Pre-C2HC domain-containing protein n=1 Tax=Trichonephila clavipes TaxID=2585209 RepID=A0A8X6RGJ4_TRICX|nr:hypothetical protein TNCV_1246511 [Trichonephila clavipes]